MASFMLWRGEERPLCDIKRRRRVTDELISSCMESESSSETSQFHSWISGKGSPFALLVPDLT
jgi:hypothetical protein